MNRLSTAEVTGGQAGLSYGYDGIPEEWILVQVKKRDIEEMVDRLCYCVVWQSA